LARSIDFHLSSTSATRETAVGGKLHGLISADEEVEWRAKHFGLWLKMRVKITAFRPPEYFQDSMMRGPFRFFNHEHFFEERDHVTLMKDKLIFRSPLPLFGWLIDRFVLLRYLRNLISVRNSALKMVAESGQWRDFLLHNHNEP